VELTALFPSPAADSAPSPAAPTLSPHAAASAGARSPSAIGTLPPSSPAPEPPCQRDDDCGYDPTARRCGADPRFNKQPPLVDQGVVCYCDAGTSACALLRVDPAPCEGDTSCAVRLDPRPHPVRASAELPYEKPRACRPPKPGQPRATLRHVTCERTNICTMFTRECAP
jgi:hypothetical protein